MLPWPTPALCFDVAPYAIPPGARVRSGQRDELRRRRRRRLGGGGERHAPHAQAGAERLQQLVAGVAERARAPVQVAHLEGRQLQAGVLPAKRAWRGARVGGNS
jgi:hypothetical protein